MAEKKQPDFLFRDNLASLDPAVQRLIELEEERQVRKIIMIASESTAPIAVREALGSVFTNLYAEGYPSLKMCTDPEEMLLEHNHELSHIRRYSDRRYYKGVENVDFIETLARRRCAEIFAANGVSPKNVYVNVQPLSGAAANNAVYQAFLKNGDTVMGLDLSHGGHLTHGSPVNRSGMSYNVVAYKTSHVTGLLDYDEIARLAKEYRPKMIIAGYSAYPRTIDWAKFREIADSVGNGCILLADISHPAGLVAAGQFPSPVGVAHVTSFTTHKTLCGPRGACLITTEEEKAALIDVAVFPGEQGGPHINNIAAKAVMFEIAKTDSFKKLQKKIVENAAALADAFRAEGMDIAYGGTDSHMMLIDLRKFKGLNGVPLRAEMPSRILDVCGLTCNKNAIFGDEIPAYPSGLRFGTTWVSQRGLGPEHMKRIAKAVSTVIKNITPFDYMGLLGILGRGKMPLKAMEEAKAEITAIAAEMRSDIEPKTRSDYPYYTPIEVRSGRATPLAAAHEKAGAKMCQVGGWKVAMSFTSTNEELAALKKSAALLDIGHWTPIEIVGDRAVQFMTQVCTSDIFKMKPGDCIHTFILDDESRLIDDVIVLRRKRDGLGRDRFIVCSHPKNSERLLMWLRGLADGYITFDHDDLTAKVEGPAVVEDLNVCQDLAARKTMLAVIGPKATDVAGKVGKVAKLEQGKFVEAKIGDVEVLIVHHNCHVGENVVLFLVHPDKVASLWSKLTEAGARPAGEAVRSAVRKEHDLPVYDAAKRPTGAELCKKFEDAFDLHKFYFIGQKEIAKAVKPSAQKKLFKWAPSESEPRKTWLYEEHLKLTKKAFMIPFAGWVMPVWYTSVGEEHEAVRKAAGLFDVSHMGVLGFDGDYAARFLDMVTTNYVFWLNPGQSQYAYILGPHGDVIDDCMVYCLARDRYMMVVNASNAEKVIAWFRMVISGEALLDPANSTKRLEAEFTFRDLKDPSSGERRRIDLALQGPNSLKILQSLTNDPAQRDALARIPRTGLAEMKLAGFDLVVSRTGYTGEEVCFELFVHPDKSVAFWRLLLEKGKAFGLKPTGLGSRDSTRTEAGLPLYGHELEGEMGITPIGAGYPAYVKLHKPFFIGKKALLEKEKTRTMEIVRWKMNLKGVRSVHNGDPVVNKRGQFIGKVTSACLVEGYQMGLAYVEGKYTDVGTPIGIFALPHDGKVAPESPKDKLKDGDKLYLHDWAEVIPRFPERKKGLPMALGKLYNAEEGMA